MALVKSSTNSKTFVKTTILHKVTSEVEIDSCVVLGISLAKLLTLLC
jgi:hypothetical protein